MRRLTQSVRSIRLVVRRRGTGYFAYMLTGIVLPRVVLGHPLVRRVFARLARPLLSVGGPLELRFRAAAEDARQAGSGESYPVMRALLQQHYRQIDFWYAPVDFGLGLTAGSFWSTDSGTGRWEYLNGPIVGPLVEGKRVLDLGSNNGVAPLMMLRLGASAVAGIEREDKYVESARILRSVIEWVDMRTYDLEIVHDDMLSILNRSFGDVDVVTAFCSLYYLDEDDMAKVVRKAADLAPLMIVQGSIVKGKGRTGVADRRADPAFLRDLLLQNGYQDVRVAAPRGFSRPLLVGST